MSNELARNVTNAAQGASVTSVAAADSNVALLGSTLGRRGLIVYNDCDKSLYLKYGATSSLSSYTVKIAPGGCWEMPTPPYTGAIHGVWSTGPTGSAKLTELT